MELVLQETWISSSGGEIKIIYERRLTTGRGASEYIAVEGLKIRTARWMFNCPTVAHSFLKDMRADLEKDGYLYQLEFDFFDPKVHINCFELDA